MISYIVTFLVGALTGAAANYLANKFTDQRREQDSLRKARQRFQNLKDKIPKLIAEMQHDLRLDGFGLIREFYILPKASDVNLIIPWRGLEPTKNVLCYYVEDHRDLENQVVLLENNGYVTKLGEPEGQVPAAIYRMSEDFAEQLLR
jgi:hypothetical protein